MPAAAPKASNPQRAWLQLLCISHTQTDAATAAHKTCPAPAHTKAKAKAKAPTLPCAALFLVTTTAIATARCELITSRPRLDRPPRASAHPSTRASYKLNPPPPSETPPTAEIASATSACCEKQTACDLDLCPTSSDCPSHCSALRPAPSSPSQLHPRRPPQPAAPPPTGPQYPHNQTQP